MAARGDYNFAAGPAAIPAPVLARAREQLFAGGKGGGLLERPFSHPDTRALIAGARRTLAR
ncbi:MAG: 3-phosphoserine/phosphohydroxythreonine transaminase, partial [Proteobacteria bacterium]|nr:3-phosphoserine/phosphohydroxythreonine transaminase [Pseudomonadota bacterium]